MPETQTTHSSIEVRLLLLLGGIAGVALLGVLAIVPYRLYQRDVRLAEQNAHRVGSLLHVSLASALEHGSDVQDVAALVNRLQGAADMQLRLRQLPPGESPEGDPSGAGSSVRNDTDLTYTAPPILDRDGHAWVASMHFDLSPMKRDSMRLIFDLVAAVAIGSALFSLAVFLLIRGTLFQPLREVTRRVEAYADGHEPGPAPPFESREMQRLLDALDRARQRA